MVRNAHTSYNLYISDKMISCDWIIWQTYHIKNYMIMEVYHIIFFALHTVLCETAQGSNDQHTSAHYMHKSITSNVICDAKLCATSLLHNKWLTSRTPSYPWMHVPNFGIANRTVSQYMVHVSLMCVLSYVVMIIQAKACNNDESSCLLTNWWL